MLRLNNDKGIAFDVRLSKTYSSVDFFHNDKFIVRHFVDNIMASSGRINLIRGNDEMYLTSDNVFDLQTAIELNMIKD